MSIPAGFPDSVSNEKTFMNCSFAKKLVLATMLGSLSFGCSALNKNSQTDTGQAANTVAQTTEKAVVSSPCANIYNPVKDGAIKNYNVSLGGKDARFVQQYTDGAPNFTEELTVGETTVKHTWECTSEGLIAANPGSMLNSQEMKLTPKHISGVTLPKDSDLAVGKTWTTVYQVAGKSAVGDINSQVTVNNKVISLDDEVKVPAGTFKALKVETVLDTEMKLNGSKIGVPPIKTFVWYAPNVGMIKNGDPGGAFGATMEYTGDK
jgi:hypothetical protein